MFAQADSIWQKRGKRMKVTKSTLGLCAAGALLLAACTVSPQVEKVVQQAYKVSKQTAVILSELSVSPTIPDDVKAKLVVAAQACVSLNDGLVVVAKILGIPLDPVAVNSKDVVSPEALQASVDELKQSIDTAK